MTNKKSEFVKWVESHDPQAKWDWNNPHSVCVQLADIVGETGSIDLKTVFDMFFQNEDVFGEFDTDGNNARTEKWKKYKFR